MFTGLRVLEFGQYVAAPIAGMVLGDSGADVIKVERPGGDPLRSLPAYQTWNRNKQILQLDLRSAEGRQTAHELVAGADVVIDGLKPGLLDRCGLGGAALLADQPSLIYCSLPGFAPEARVTDGPAWEPIIAAAAGLFRPAREGSDRDAAVFTPLPFASIYGGLLAANSIAAAIYERDRSGLGQQIETPIHSALFLAAGYALQRVGNAGQPLGRGANPMVTTYRCADGRWVQFHAALPHFIAQFIASQGLQAWEEEGLFDRAAWATDPEVVRTLQTRLTDLFAQHTAEEWETRLSAAGLCCVVCRRVEEWIDHPHPAASGLIDVVASPYGAMRQPGRLVQTKSAEQAPLEPAHDVTAGGVAWRVQPAHAPSAPPAATRTPHGPLAGLRVLDLCLILAGPTCGRTLAEFGADVLKIDAPQPTLVEPFWLDTNRGKRSILLDLKQPAGRDVLWTLLATADVVVENFRKGVAERLGVGYELVSAKFPRIVYVSMNCYGYEGPFASRPGWEQLAQATSGMQARYGGRDARPQLAPYAVNDYATGLAGAFGVLSALHERELTGRGQRTTVALASTAGLLQSIYMFDYPGYMRQEIEGQQATGYSALSRLYRCADDWLYVHGTQSARKLAAHPDFRAIFADDRASMDGAADSWLAMALAACFVERDVSYWLAVLDGLAIPAVRATTPEALGDDPRMRAAGLITTTDSPSHGPIQHVGIPHRLARTPAANGPAAPVPGGDTLAILRELGYDDEAISGLLSDRAACTLSATTA